MRALSRCECKHPWHHHEFVKGIPDVPGSYVTNEAGERLTFGDIWVCTGDHDQVYDPEKSPWDYVCGCVLHHAPPLELA